MTALDALIWLGLAVLAGLFVLVFVFLLGVVKYVIAEATKGGER